MKLTQQEYERFVEALESIGTAVHELTTEVVALRDVLSEQLAIKDEYELCE